MEQNITNEIIQNKIHIINGQKVMLDFDLAELYEVKTKTLNQSVKRNIDRFPEDFMIKIDINEHINLRSQIVTSNYGSKRNVYYAFTEQGVAMLSSVLNSKKSIQVNIQIMRAFTRLRQMIVNYSELKDKIEELEETYDENFRMVFQLIKSMLHEEEKPKEQIGFKVKS
jgi:DNA-binding PadR family transcriptional regulator